MRRAALFTILAGALLSSGSVLAVTHNVTVGNNFFSSNNLTIAVGDTVRWTNNSGFHDVTADDFSWSSPTSNSFVFERTFNSVDEVLYHCTVHSSPGLNISTNMNGRINVVQSGENQAPTADFSSNCANLDCNFTDQSSDPDGSIASRSWNFGDGGSSTSANPSHSYASAGTYSVMLTVTDDDGAPDSVSKNVTVSAPGNQDPLADFAFSCSGLSCDFTDESSDPDGSIASHSWNFGDSGSSTATNPSHSYAAAATYNVMLTVTDNDGASDSLTRMVTVAEPGSEFQINAAIADAWFSPLTDGQGFFIIVWEDNGLIFLSWFTYDTERPPEDVMAILGEPGHRWLTAQGPYSEDTATLNVYLTSGGVFDAASPAPETGEQPIGTITIVWTGCNSGTLNYNLPSLGLSSAIAIERIVLDKVPDCEAAQPQQE
jgi:PKD repeat protein